MAQPQWSNRLSKKQLVWVYHCQCRQKGGSPGSAKHPAAPTGLSPCPGGTSSGLGGSRAPIGACLGFSFACPVTPPDHPTSLKCYNIVVSSEQVLDASQTGSRILCCAHALIHVPWLPSLSPDPKGISSVHMDARPFARDRA